MSFRKTSTSLFSTTYSRLRKETTSSSAFVCHSCLCLVQENCKHLLERQACRDVCSSLRLSWKLAHTSARARRVVVFRALRTSPWLRAHTAADSPTPDSKSKFIERHKEREDRDQNRIRLEKDAEYGLLPLKLLKPLTWREGVRVEREWNGRNAAAQVHWHEQTQGHSRQSSLGGADIC